MPNIEDMHRLFNDGEKNAVGVFAFTVTGRAIPGLIQGLSAEENFAAEGFTLIAESEKEVTQT